MDKLEKHLRQAATALGAVASACLVFLMLLTFGDVIGRYFLNAPITFTVEITELMMGLVIMLGLALTTLNDGHISVDILTRALSPKGRRIPEFIARLCAVAFLGVITWQLFAQFLLVMNDGLFTQVLGTPVYPFVLIMALVAGFACLLAAWRLIKRHRGPTL